MEASPNPFSARSLSWPSSAPLGRAAVVLRPFRRGRASTDFCCPKSTGVSLFSGAMRPRAHRRPIEGAFQPNQHLSAGKGNALRNPRAPRRSTEGPRMLEAETLRTSGLDGGKEDRGRRPLRWLLSRTRRHPGMPGGLPHAATFMACALLAIVTTLPWSPRAPPTSPPRARQMSSESVRATRLEWRSVPAAAVSDGGLAAGPGDPPDMDPRLPPSPNPWAAASASPAA